MYYDVMVTETVTYNDGRETRHSIEIANSFSRKDAAYAYLDGIQEWCDEELRASVYRTKRSCLTIIYTYKWGLTNLSYTIKKRK